MKQLLCESIVYCDFFLLIILLIVGVLIDNKAFVCYLFVCLYESNTNLKQQKKQHKNNNKTGSEIA